VQKQCLDFCGDERERLSDAILSKKQCLDFCGDKIERLSDAILSQVDG